MATNQETISIIIKATDEATKTTKTIERELDNLTKKQEQNAKGYTAISESMTAMQAKASSTYNTINNKINEVINKNKSLQTTEKSNENSVRSMGTQALNSYNNMGLGLNNVINKIKQTQTANTGLNQSNKLVIDSLGRVRSNGINSYTNLVTSIQVANKSTQSLIRANEWAAASFTGKLRIAAENTFNTIQTKAITAFNTMQTKANSAISVMSTKFTALNTKIRSMSSNMGIVGTSIMSAFGALGVTSIYQFTIGAALAREKITTVTESITGSKQATEELNNKIKAATAGGVVGFGNVASAINTIGIKYKMTNEQLGRTPVVLNEIGTYAQMMGKSSTDAASLMAHAYDGLSGNMRTLKQLGITKDDLTKAGWSGAATDVDGYTNALYKVLATKPGMDTYLNSFDGRMARFKMSVQQAGREIGAQLLPFIQSALGAFMDLNQKVPGTTTVLAAVAIGIMALGSAAMFIIPAFELIAGLATGIIGTGKALYNATKFTYNFIKAIKDSGVIVDIFTRAASAVRNFSIMEMLATVKTKLLTAAQALWNGVTKVATAMQWLLNAAMDANPIGLLVIAIVAVVAILIYFYTTNKQVRDTLNAVGAAITGAFGSAWNWILGVFTNVSNAYNSLMTFLHTPINIDLSGITAMITNFWTYLTTLPAQLGAWLLSIGLQVTTWLISLPMTIWNYLMLIILRISAFELIIINKAYSIGFNFVTRIVSFYIQLPGRIWVYLMQCITRVSTWGTHLYTKAVGAGSRFLNGVILHIRQLPGRVGSYLSSVISRTISWASSIVAKARSAGTRFVTGFMTYIKQLPGKVWQEMQNIGAKISSAASGLIAKAKAVASGILKAFLNTLGIHSPGFMANNIKDEMGRVISNIGNAAGNAYSKAKTLGNNIVKGFGNPTLNTNVTGTATGTALNNNTTTNTSPVTPTSTITASSIPTINSNITPTLGTVTPPTSLSNAVQGVTSPTNLSPANGGINLTNPQAVQTSTTAVAQAVTTGTGLINTQLTSLQTKLSTLTTSATTNTNQLLANNNGSVNSYNNMTNRVKTDLDNIKSKNSSAWSNVKSVTQNDLSSMQTSTKSTTSKMTSAWDTMKTSIVSAASNIRSQSTSHFNKLSSTIGSFYHKIQNPGGFGTPHGVTPRSHKFAGGGFKAIQNSMRPPSSQISPQNPIINRQFIMNSTQLTGAERTSALQYLTPDTGFATNNDALMFDMESLRNIRNKSAGGWSGIVSPNTSYIKNKSDTWTAKAPVILGKYNTGVDQKVGKFENFSSLDYPTFKEMMTNVFDQCNYDFYWNSEKYGNWLTAFENGNMNCSDSSDALIAMAKASGLSASKVHGTWNGIGHYWAEVDGHKMDPTGEMLGYGWTPSQSGAGPIKHHNAGGITGLDSNNSNENNNIIHSGTIKLELKHTIDATNLPENITATEVANILNEKTNDPQFLKEIALNNDFQKWDNKKKESINRQYNRNNGG